MALERMEIAANVLVHDLLLENISDLLDIFIFFVQPVADLDQQSGFLAEEQVNVAKSLGFLLPSIKLSSRFKCHSTDTDFLTHEFICPTRSLG